MIGVFDDAVIRTAVMTKSLTGCRYIKSDEIGSCFMWQFGKIVGCLHGFSKLRIK